jgi:hypothetical protein
MFLIIVKRNMHTGGSGDDKRPVWILKNQVIYSNIFTQYLLIGGGVLLIINER